MESRTTSTVTASDAGVSAPTERRSVAERRERGQIARQRTPRKSHGQWVPAADRRDPIELLRGQDAARQPELVPIRWGRMSVSPFAYFRGSAAVMASDLADTRRTDLIVQLCGDAHISNFGLFASPERTLLFDVNDFDETLPGPFEWDVKRLAASAVIAARDNGFTENTGRDAALAAVRSYREHMAAFAEMDETAIWYSRVSADELLSEAGKLGRLPKGAGKRVAAGIAKARTRTSLHALGKLTTVTDGELRIIDDPPLIFRVSIDDTEMRRVVEQAFADYQASLTDDKRALVQRYTLRDIGHKVVGVGSVGTMCLIALLTGRDDNDPLFLQIKEAGPSVLEAYLGKSRYANGGQRVVAGQRLMQAASDIFLGWIEATGPARRHLYFRQLRDMKGSAEISAVRPSGLAPFSAVCAWTLARAHARSGDAVAISAYLGKGDQFDKSIAAFAAAYADQMERDYELLTKSIESGAVPATPGL